MKQKEQFLKAALTVLEAVIDASEDQAFGGNTMGSGGHARAFGNGEFYKVVIPGDDKFTVKTQLAYLLGDLAVDLDLPSEIRGALYGRID